jgi:hypothetical protein
MKLSFVKTIQGHEIEFVRLMYPLRYNLFLRIVNANPLELTLKKDSQGLWSIDEPKELPGWVNELSLPIQEAIEENEVDVIGE